MKLKCVVVGTGRCGTVYTARFLTSVGMPCGHESVFDYRGLDFAIARLDGHLPIETSDCSLHSHVDGAHDPIPVWINNKDIVAESSYLAAPFLSHSCLKDTKIIHQVRNPVNIINSFVNYLCYFEHRHPALWEPAKTYETFIYSHVPELYWDMSQIERCVLYYVRWNQLIEKQLEGRNYLRHKVEDPNDELFEYLDIPKQSDFFNDKESNTFRRQGVVRFHLGQLPTGGLKDEFLEMSNRYGYKTGLKYLTI